MVMRRALFFSFCVTLLTLSGCAGAFNPFQRVGDWSETGAANETIAQQVANPGDLIEGQSSATSNGVAASAAIDQALGPDGAGTAKGLETPTVITSTTASISTGN